MRIIRKNLLVILLIAFLLPAALFQLANFNGCERGYTTEIKGTEEAILT
ncbi:MAG: hypothetical protein ACP5US_08985 [Candidatus Kryptoniota bacterium]